MPENAKAARKQRSHELILESAARLVRQRGIAGTSVADVMKGARLTVGGFYAHFASKEALIDDAIARTGRQLRERLFRKTGGSAAATIVARYLSPEHRDARETGCPLPAVTGEVATTAPAHGPALAAEIDAFARELRAALPARQLSGDRALAVVALLAGGLGLSRAVRGTTLSDRILRACRHAALTLV